jgi:hypothetical protein
MQAIETAERLSARDAALADLAAIVDPGAKWSTWRRAGAVSDLLRRFQRGPMPG